MKKYGWCILESEIPKWYAPILHGQMKPSFFGCCSNDLIQRKLIGTWQNLGAPNIGIALPLKNSQPRLSRNLPPVREETNGKLKSWEEKTLSFMSPRTYRNDYSQKIASPSTSACKWKLCKNRKQKLLTVQKLQPTDVICISYTRYC